MTEASDPGQAVERHERTSEPDLKQVQHGWKVFDRMGRQLGEVTERDDASVVVVRDRAPGDRTRIPLELIAREDPEARRATLSVPASEVDRIVAGDHG